MVPGWSTASFVLQGLHVGKVRKVYAPMKRGSETAEVSFKGVNGGVFKEVLNTASSEPTLRTGERMRIWNLMCENAEIKPPGYTNQNSECATTCNKYSSKGYFSNCNIFQNCNDPCNSVSNKTILLQACRPKSLKLK
jgi:hypothetical protein